QPSPPTPPADAGGTVKPVATTFDFAKKRPLDLLIHLARLEAKGQTNLFIEAAPEGWIKAYHLPCLMELLDSNEPCASVTCTLSSVIDRSGRPSTIGHEAAYLIKSFREGRRYPCNAGASSSAFVSIDKNDIRAWWAEYQKKGAGPVLPGTTDRSPEP